MNGTETPPLPDGAKMVTPTDQIPPLPKGAKLTAGQNLPPIDTHPVPAQGDNAWAGAFKWLFGIGYGDKPGLIEDVQSYLGREGQRRYKEDIQEAASGKWEQELKDNLARIDASKESEAGKKYLRELAHQKYQARTSGFETGLRQFAPSAARAGLSVATGAGSKENLALTLAGEAFKPLRAPVGAYFAYQGAKTAMEPRRPGESAIDYFKRVPIGRSNPNEPLPDYLERVLFGLSAVAGGTAYGRSAELPPVSEKYRVKKLTYATQADPESIRATLPVLLDEARKQGKPKRGGDLGEQSIEDVQKYVDTALADRERVFNTELQRTGDVEQLPTTVSAEIRGLIKPNMENTAQGQADIQYINERAAEFDKPWSLRALNEERMAARKRQGSAPYQKTEARMKRSPDIDLDIDRAIERSSRDLVYDELGRQKANEVRARGGSPEQIKAAQEEFRKLKQEQSGLLDIKSKLDDHVKAIKKASYAEAGKPFTAGQTATISAHPGGITPRVHGLGRFFGRRPLSASSKAARQAFKRLPPGTPETRQGLPPITGQTPGEPPPETPPSSPRGGRGTPPGGSPPDISVPPERRGASGYSGPERRAGTRSAADNPRFAAERTIREAGLEAEPAGFNRELGTMTFYDPAHVNRKAIMRVEDIQSGGTKAVKAAMEKRLAESEAKAGKGTKELPPIETAVPKAGAKKVKGESMMPWLEKARKEWQGQHPGEKLDFRAIANRAKELKAAEGKKSLPAVEAPKRHPESPKATLPPVSMGIPSKGQVGHAPIESLSVDPKRFQYKLDVGEGGVSNLLKGQKYNPELAGIIQVWTDPANGKTYVVNGHHRYDLAKNTGQDTILSRHINAQNEGEARAIGALTNIAEGRGTAIDAAKFMKEHGVTPDKLAEHGISMGEAKAQDGLALSKLDPYLFERVRSGIWSEGRGVAIGKATDNPATQEAIAKEIDRTEKSGKHVSDATVAELARFAANAPTMGESVQTLFGTEEHVENLMMQKAEVSAYIQKQIAQERRAFGAVSSEARAKQLGKAGNIITAEENKRIAQAASQAQAAYNKLSSGKGPVNDILDKAAQELKSGKQTAKEDAYAAVRAEIEKTFGGSSGPGTPGGPGSTGGGAPPQGQLGLPPL